MYMEHDDDTRTIAWETWDGDGRCLRTSQQHITADDDDTRTLCGRRIPAEGNGIVHENGETESPCGRCKRISVSDKHRCGL
jgi:hypothetical protein